ncbi:hypothetical protein DY245_32985, partial [Streptomyces inhibens]
MSAGAPASTLRGARGFRAVAGAMVLLALVQGAIGVHQCLTATGASYIGRALRAVVALDVRRVAAGLGRPALAAAVAAAVA